MTAQPPHFSTPSVQNYTREGAIQALREQIAGMEQARKPAGKNVISSGCWSLDLLLPEAGFCCGTLVEWLANRAGNGAASLAFGTAREASREGGAIVVLDQAQEFYPPAAARLGLSLENLVVVQAAQPADNLWALDQALRCPGVAAVVAWPEKIDARTFRRLQLAAEEGGVLGLLLRPERVRSEPSWADVRLLVEPLPGGTAGVRRLRIEILRCRAAPGGTVEVEMEKCQAPSTNDQWGWKRERRA